jgi:phosphoribosylanthranilate isomerase
VKSVSPCIKVCGLTRLEDAELAVRLGAWALGFIFYAKSPRAMTAEGVGSILAHLKDISVKKCAVFVNATPEEIVQSVRVSGVNVVQLHGDETVEYCAKLRQSLPGIQVIKALRLRDRSVLAEVAMFARAGELVLLDTYVEGEAGGTGVTGDWTLAHEAAKLTSVILAGGLNPDNIRLALDTVAPFAVDVSSSLESSHGIKSSEKMERFFMYAAEGKRTR